MSAIQGLLKSYNMKRCEKQANVLIWDREAYVSAVENRIVVSPATKFREFLEVLQNESSVPHLSARLEETHCEMSGQCTPTFKLPLAHCELSE